MGRLFVCLLFALYLQVYHTIIIIRLSHTWVVCFLPVVFHFDLFLLVYTRRLDYHFGGP